MLIPREKLKCVNEVIKDKGIPIEKYIPARVSALSALKLRPVNDLRLTLKNKTGSSHDLLWHIAYIFHNHRPGWSGYIQSIATGTYSTKSHITFLPVVDPSASDLTHIYSVLQYICNQAAKLNIATLCITFDQLLYIKASEVSKSLQMNIVIGSLPNEFPRKHW